MMTINKQSDELVCLWISKRFVSVIKLVENAFIDFGYGVSTTVNDNGVIATSIFTNNESVGSIDICNIMISIATKDFEYDDKLDNPLYEACKTRHIIYRIVSTMKILLDNDYDVAIDKLTKLSGRLPIRFQIVQRDRQ